MNREILFRGKRIDTGEWVYGAFCPDVLEIDGYGKTIAGERLWLDGFIRRYSLEENHMVMYEVKRESVGQYTGLTDRDGAKIFEGDILQAADTQFVVKFGHCGGVQNVDHEVGYVGFFLEPIGEHEKKLLNFGIRTDILYWLNAYKISVVGNMHDNPELL